MPSVSRAGLDIINTVSPIIIGLNASTDVFVNSAPAMSVGTASVIPHGVNPPHTVVQPTVSGAGTVFVNGAPIVVNGSGIACGHSVVSGSGDVFAEGTTNPTIGNF